MKAHALFALCALLALASSIDASPCCPDGPALSGSPNKATRPDGLGYCTDACTCGCNAGSPGSRCTCGEDPHAAAEVPAGGIDREAMRDDCLDDECYRLNGVRVSRRRALHAADPSIPDDSQHWRAVLLSADVARRRSFVADFETGSLAEFRSKIVAQAFAPDAWQMIDRYPPVAGIGNPVYVVDRDGQLLTPAFEYASAADTGARLKKADPTFDPSKDPKAPKDPKSPGAAADDIDLAKVPAVYWIAAGFGVLLLLARGKKY